MNAQCSILVCTHNRSEVLEKTLSCLVGHVGEIEGIELLVVDNASTDDTKLTVSKFPIARYVYEPSIGLSHARNRAVSEASNENIVFVDDDVIVSKEWINAYIEFFRQKPASVVFWGGTVEPYYEEALPPDLEYKVKHVHAAWSLIDCPEQLEIVDINDPLPIGANFGGLRSAFINTPFSSKFGRIGKKLTSGEETVLMRQFLSNGARGEWVSGAVLLHRVPVERMQADYLSRFFLDHGRSSYHINRRHNRLQLGLNCLKNGLRAAYLRLSDPSYYYSKVFVKWRYYWGSLLESFSRR